MAKYCQNCGAQAADEAKFCLSCGHQFAAPPPPAQQPTYQQPTYQQPTYQQPTYQQPPYQPPYQQVPTAAKDRPGCVIVYLVLMILAALFFLVVFVFAGGLLADVMPMFGSGSGTGIAVIVIGVVIAALFVAVAIGAYELKVWAPVAAIIIHALVGLLYLVGLISTLTAADRVGYTPTGSIIVAIVILALQGIAIWWFAQNREYFTY